MNRKDLTVAQEAGQTVAYAEYDGIDSNYAAEVKIIDTQATRTVYSSGRMFDRRGHQSPGIKIEYVSGHRAGEQTVVPSQKLVATWAEYTARREARENREENRKSTLAETQLLAEAQAEQIKSIYKATTGQDARYGKVRVTHNGHQYGNHYQAATKYSVEVDTDVMAVLLDKSEKLALYREYPA